MAPGAGVRETRVGSSAEVDEVEGEVGRTRDVIDLRVPADPAYLAVIRTATVGVAMRLDLTLDEIEDLRIAVDEACALLLADGRGQHQNHPEYPNRPGRPGRPDGPDGGLHALFTLDTRSGGRLDVRIAGPRGRAPLDAGYPWMLLQALVSEVATGSDGSGRWIALSRSGPTSGPGTSPQP